MYDSFFSKLTSIIDKAILNKNVELAMSGMSSYCNVKYKYNQDYCDDHIENQIVNIGRFVLKNQKSFKSDETNKNLILFYDGFGYNTRGLAIIYLKALIRLGYEIAYITDINSKGNQKDIIEILEGGKHTVNYIDKKCAYKKQIRIINDLFLKYKPSRAFFYTYPDDIAAAAVFSHYENKVTRFQINLTDHAFWIGKCAMDVCIEFREYGESISKYYRYISDEKIVLLPYYPYYNKKIQFEGFDFDNSDRKKIIFSGGSLYKTLGGNNKYYSMIDSILKKYTNTIFLYAGTGDSTKINELMKKWPERVYHIDERQDLYELMKHIDVYVNTYPISGGLMTQYAAIAGKVPLILNDNSDKDSDGILINQDNLNIEFKDIESLICEVGKLINNEKYKKSKENIMKKSVITEEEFTYKLSLIVSQKNDRLSDIKKIDTFNFRNEYKKLFTYEKLADTAISIQNRKIIKYFPALFLTKAYTILKSKICK